MVMDHPHGRGENLNSTQVVLQYNGPSPRAWGKLRVLGKMTLRPRTIPTGVGKTLFSTHTNRG